MFMHKNTKGEGIEEVKAAGATGVAEIVHRGTWVIRNRQPVRPYSRNVPRLLLWSYGGAAFSYERGTPVGGPKHLELVDHPEGGANREWGENNIRLRMERQRVSSKWRDSVGGGGCAGREWPSGRGIGATGVLERYWNYRRRLCGRTRTQCDFTGLVLLSRPAPTSFFNSACATSNHIFSFVSYDWSNFAIGAVGRRDDDTTQQHSH